MKNTLLITALLAFASFPTFAQTESSQENGQSRLDAAEKEFLNGDVSETRRIIFEQLDVNEDAEVSKEEATQNDALLVQFSQLDQNGDGKLSFEEFSEWQAFDSLDANQ